MTAPAVTTVQRGWFLASSATAARTLARMAALVRAALADPLVWETARDVVAAVEPRDQLGQAAAIRRYVASRLRFVDDPRGVELIPDPRYLLRGIRARGTVQGDCDDAAVLAAALGEAVGIPAEFVAGAADTRGPYVHVYAVLYPRSAPSSVVRQAVEMDTTRPAWVPALPTFAKTLRYRVT